MSNEILQIERLALGTVDVNENVIFDTTLIIAGSINYDNASGAITLLETGRYKFDWWVATQSSSSSNGAVFALVSSQGDTLIGNSPIKTGEVYGTGIIEVTSAPVTIALQSNSTSIFYYPSIVPVKAALTVFEIQGEGLIGPTGPQGPIGPQGPTGPQGATGPTGPGITVFGEVFTPLGEFSETAAQLPGDIIFTDNGLLVGGITHTPGNSEVIVPADGPYIIRYSISISNNIETVVSIAVNGAVVSSSSVPSQLTIGTFSNAVILSLSANDIVTLTVE